MKEYTEEKNAWYLQAYNKVANEYDDNVMINQFDTNGLTLDDILHVFYDSDVQESLKSAPLYYFKLTTKDQAQGIQKYVKNHIIDLNQYRYSLDYLHSPRVYTVYGLKKLIERNDVNVLSDALCDFAQYNDIVEDFITVLQMIDTLSARDIRFGKRQIIGRLVSGNMKINDNLLLYYLEQGVNDPDVKISNRTKISINNVLSKNNPKLYEFIKSKYDLYVPDDYYLE